MKHPPQEADQIPGRAMVGVGVGVVIAAVVGVLIAYGLEHCGDRSGEGPAFTGDVNGMETRAFALEAQGLEDHARDEQQLQTYGWSDRAHRIVHVPIDVAFDLYLRRQP
jgi:hypothetical protein